MDNSTDNVTEDYDYDYNFTSDADPDNGILTENHVYTAIFIVIFAAILVGNGFVIVVYHKRTSLRTLGNFITIQVAYADVSVCVGILYHVYTLYIPNLDSNSLFCSTKYAILFFPVTVTNFLLVLLSTDRYLHIVHPFKHDSIMKPWRVYSAVASCWLLAIILTGVCPIVFKLVMQQERPEICAMIVGVTPQYFATIGLPSIVTCLVIISAIYARIYLIVRQKNRATQHLTTSLANNQLSTANGADNQVQQRVPSNGEINGNVAKKSSLKRDVKALRTLGIILGSFVGCWSPFVIMIIIEICLNLPPDHTFGIFRGLMGLVGMFNAITNPFIYAKRMTDFQKEFRKLICRGQKVRSSSDDCSNSASQSQLGSHNVENHVAGVSPSNFVFALRLTTIYENENSNVR